MHVYSIDNSKRDKVIAVISVADIALTAMLEYYKLEGKVINWLLVTTLHISETHFVYYLVSACIHALVPISIYALLFWFYENFMWKWGIMYKWHNIPNLNGSWEGTVKSPLKPRTVNITAEIKQTWNKLQVSTQSPHSRAYSETAVISTEPDGETYFRYSFQTLREGEAPYIGYNKLRFEQYQLSGEYFTNKALGSQEQGKGSKGTIILRRV